MSASGRSNKHSLSTGRLSARQRLASVAWAPFVAVLLLAPWAWVKVLGACGIIISLRAIPALSRNAMTSLLFLLFAMAYLLSPYWLVPINAKYHAIGPILGNRVAAIVTAAILFAMGTIWARLSAGKTPELERPEGNLLAEAAMPATLAVIAVAMNMAPLYYSLPIHGDEAWHIARLRELRAGIEPLLTTGTLPLTILLTVTGAVVICLLRKPAIHQRVLTVLAIVVALAVWMGFLNGQNITYRLVRYPYISSWMHLPGVMQVSLLFDEGAQRIVPLTAAFGTGCFVLWTLQKHGANRIGALLAGVAIITIPNIYYHSTELYLEMPAMALLTVALWYIERLVRDDPETLRTCPGWYAILAAGFIKETLVAVLAVVIAIRLVVRAVALAKIKPWPYRQAVNELLTIACMAVPLGLYLWMRTFFDDIRAYKPVPSHMFDPEIYVAMGRAMWSQFGLLLPLAGAGFVMAAAKKRYLWAISLAAVFAADCAFHMMDEKRFAGTARFNLVLLAPLIVAAMELMIWMAKRRMAITITAAIWLAVNMALSPVAIGGEKKPYWASPDTVTSEFYFPKRQAVTWLRDNRSGSPVVVAGTLFDPGLGWYFNKLNYRPATLFMESRAETEPMERLSRAIALAESQKVPLVLYFRMTPGPDLREEEKVVGRYRAIQVFANKYLSIALYEAASAR